MPGRLALTGRREPLPVQVPERLTSGVAAVVVTYRRPRLATLVVRSLLEDEGLDPSQVFVVVNGEGGLEDPDLEAHVAMVRLVDNLGPAGGFREGVKAAESTGSFDWYYLCEDDIALFDLPRPRLEGLLRGVSGLDEPARTRIGAVVAYGRDLHRSTGHTTVHEVTGTSGFEPVDAACWGATLLNARVLRAGVEPVDDYFFGYEDFDFFYRMREAGFDLLVDRTAASAVARHMSLDGREQAFLGSRPVDTDEPWRAFYVARNYFLLSRRHGTWRWVAAHLAYSARRFQLAASNAERMALLQGLAAGALGHSGKDTRFLRDRGELTRRLVLHVLPNDIARGGQAIVRDLRDVLDREDDRHEILTIFASEPVLLNAKHRLEMPMGRLRHLGFDPVALLALRRALRAIQADVVVAHGGEPLKYLAPLRRPARPLLYFSFGIATRAARSGWRRSLYRWLTSQATLVAGISHETADEARDLFGVPPERLELLPNSRDPNVFYPASPTRAAANSQVKLIFVGHLTATKRPLLFVELVAELRRRGLDVAGEMLGDGPLETQVREMSSRTSVDVLGRRTDVADRMRHADVFVFTSIPESEGMPGVLIEAGMSGLPTVATACPGVSTVIVEGETGRIVPVDDFARLVEATATLVADSDLRQSMGSAARKRCVADFSLDASATRWRAALNRLAPIPHSGSL